MSPCPAPYLKDSRTEVPMRFVGNHLNAKIDWDGATSTVIMKVRDTVNCDPPCCTYSTTNVIPPDLIRELAPGQSYTYQYKFTNTCPEGHLPLKFFFSHQDKISFITPETFSLYPGQSQVIDVRFQMPTNAPSDAEVDFSFRVNTDCGHNEEIGWKLRSRSTCCDWLFRMKPELEKKKIYLCPGETTTIEDYELFNNCPVGASAMTFTISWPRDGDVLSVSPKSFTLQPQERKILSITVKMKDSCRSGEAVSFPFNINSQECSKKTVEFVAYCKQC